MPKEAKNKENKKVKKAKDKKSFFKDTKAELKKVIWPTSKQLVNNTLAVIAVVLIIGIIVLVLDVCFEKINEFGVDKLKTTIQSSQSNNEETTNQNTESKSTDTETSEAENSDATVEGQNESTETTSEQSEDTAEGATTDDVTENAE